MNTDPASDNNIASATKPRRSNTGFKLFAIIFGISILSFVIYRAGVQTILESLGKVGWTFFIVVGLNGSRHLLRALGIYVAVPNRPSTFKYRNAVAARLGGEAAGIITFTGVMVSEATKATLLKSRLSLHDSIATIVTDNIVYDISVILMILGGAGVMLSTFGGGDSTVTTVLMIVVVLMILAFTGILLLARYRFKPLSYLLKKFAEAKWMPGVIARKKAKIFELENTVENFYINRRGAFYGLLVINILAHVLSVLEVFVILRVLGVPSNVGTAFIIESLTKVINITFSFIPGNLGVYEGGASVIFHTLGYAAATGVALALVRRGAILTWTAVGIIILLWRTVKGNIVAPTQKIGAEAD